MKSPNHIYIKESKIVRKKDIPKINFDDKLLSLPIINKNICFSDRPINLNKKALEGYKPKEDKKTRNKIETKFNNNGETNLNIKYLSLNQKNNPDNLLYLLKRIKIKESNNYKNKLINEDLFNNNSFTNKKLILLNKNDNLKKENNNIHNYSQTPKKLKSILINDPKLSYNNINTNQNGRNINGKISEYNYPISKTENNKNEKERKLIIHNVFFQWILDNMKSSSFDNTYLYNIINKKDELNCSYDLSSNSLTKSFKIRNKYNKKIKSADLSKTSDKNMKRKFNSYKNDNKNNEENIIKSNFINKFKCYNPENIDMEYINTKSFQNLFNILSRKKNSNIYNINSSFSKIKDNNMSSKEMENNKEKILLLKDEDNFLGRFINKLLQNIDAKIKKDNQPSKNKDNIKEESFTYREYTNIIKNEEKEKEKEKEKININKDYKLNKSLKLEQKLHLSDLNEKVKFKEYLTKKQNEKNKILEYKGKEKHNKLERSDISKKHFNIILISSPEEIIKDKKKQIEPLNSSRKNINDNIQNQRRSFTNKKSNDNENINSINPKERKVSQYFKEINTHNSQKENGFNNNKNNSLKQNNNLIPSNTINNINSKNNLRHDLKIIDNSKSINNNNNNNNLNEIRKYVNNDNSENLIYSYKNCEKKEDISETTNNFGSNKHTKENAKIYNTRNKNNLINNKHLKYKIYKTDNNININNEITDDENNEDNVDFDEEEKEEENTLDNFNENINENFNYIENKNEFKDNKKEKKIKINIKEEYNNINISPLKKRDKEKKISDENNISKNPVNKNINSNNISINKKRKYSVIINKRRGSYIIQNKNKRRKTINADIKSIENIFNNKEVSKEKNEIIPENSIIKNENERENKNDISSEKNENKSDISSEQKENDEKEYPPLKNIEKDLELENLLSKKTSKKRKSKTKKTEIKKEKEEENEDEEEYELIKIVKKRKKSLVFRNSIMNFLNNIEEDIDKNEELKKSYSNSLSKEDINNLIIYSTKLRKISELDENMKTEEIIQIEKELKEKYNQILNKYLMKQIKKDLLKKKENNKINKKNLKILYEENNEEEDEDEVEYKLKKKEKKIKEKKEENIYVKMKIEDSEEEEKEIEKNEKKEEEKKLIYDNSYLFNKNEKEKNIAIKKEVLDILNSNQNFTDNNNENKKMNSNYNNDINRRRKSKILNSIINSRKVSKINFNHLRKLRPKKIPVDKYKLSLFSDIKEKKIEKVEKEEDEKEKTLDEKLELFFKEIQRMKKNGINIDFPDFLKIHEIKEKEQGNRLIDFMDNINNIRDKNKCNKSKWNFLSPIQFRTKNYQY